MGLRMGKEELGEERELVLGGTKLKRHALCSGRGEMRTTAGREGGRKRREGNKGEGLMVGN